MNLDLTFDELFSITTNLATGLQELLIKVEEQERIQQKLRSRLGRLNQKVCDVCPFNSRYDEISLALERSHFDDNARLHVLPDLLVFFTIAITFSYLF